MIINQDLLSVWNILRNVGSQFLLCEVLENCKVLHQVLLCFARKNLHGDLFHFFRCQLLPRVADLCPYPLLRLLMLLWGNNNTAPPLSPFKVHLFQKIRFLFSQFGRAFPKWYHINISIIFSFSIIGIPFSQKRGLFCWNILLEYD